MNYISRTEWFELRVKHFEEQSAPCSYDAFIEHPDDYITYEWMDPYNRAFMQEVDRYQKLKLIEQAMNL